MAASPEFQQLLTHIKAKSRKEKEENKKLFNRLKKKKPAGLEKAARTYHDEVFRKINCLDCANCCRVAQPVFEKPDINRISKHLGISSKAFIEKYLKPDPDYEYLPKKLPCVFIGDDNKCSIYEIRPLGCRTYPPAKLRLTPEQLDVLHDNIGICPAVSEIVDRIKENFATIPAK